MHIRSFTLPLALLASLVTASPLGTDMSKRSDSNELMEPRRLPSVHVCTGWNCGGTCTEYFLNFAAGECIGTVSFTSAYVFSEGALSFGVHVGHECDSDSVALSNLNSCYNAGGDAYYIS